MCFSQRCKQDILSVDLYGPPLSFFETIYYSHTEPVYEVTQLHAYASLHYHCFYIIAKNTESAYFKSKINT